jgi:hypothetical protein
MCGIDVQRCSSGAVLDELSILLQLSSRDAKLDTSWRDQGVSTPFLIALDSSVIRGGGFKDSSRS